MQGNASVDEWIVSGIEFPNGKKEQMERASRVLAKELLYLKFVQGVPVVGILGGVSDVVYQKKIADYAAIKYKKRFLNKELS